MNTTSELGDQFRPSDLESLLEKGHEPARVEERTEPELDRRPVAQRLMAFLAPPELGHDVVAVLVLLDQGVEETIAWVQGNLNLFRVDAYAT